MLRMSLMGAMTMVACATPYQQRGFSGGYNDTSLGNGRWMINVDVNGYTSRSTAMEYSYRRAGELCPSGFDPVDADRSDNYGLYNNGKTASVVNKPTAMLVVQCRPTEVERLAAEEQSRASRPVVAPSPTLPAPNTEPKVVEGTAPLYCAISDKFINSGICSFDSATCDHERVALNADGSGPLAPCVERAAGACLNYSDTVSDKRTLDCFPSMSMCETVREKQLTNVDVTKVTICGVYRMKARE